MVNQFPFTGEYTPFVPKQIKEIGIGVRESCKGWFSFCFFDFKKLGFNRCITVNIMKMLESLHQVGREPYEFEVTITMS